MMKLQRRTAIGFSLMETLVGMLVMALSVAGSFEALRLSDLKARHSRVDNRITELLRANGAGFSLLEVMVTAALLSVVLFTVSQTVTLILLRSLKAMELARQEDKAARFVSDITLATKTATSWGIY